ncbi:quinolinate synthase NadA [bacterium]|nr:quinolinate synthase NadA [bacterium]
MRNVKDLVQKINKLKKEKNAIVLGHCYQNIEIDEVADYVGDSLQLSRLASQTEADIIVFAGVYFMAETAKILSPNKKVLLPKIDSGCRMADMIDLNQLKDFKAMYPNLPVVCYVNSSADVKSEADICCTSANAVQIVQSLNVPKILFAPDKYLGTYVANQLPNTEVVTYPGYCPTHLNILVEDVEKMKKQYPNAKVLAHPECQQAVTNLADYIGSTTGIMKYAKESQEKEFIIVTEKGVVDRLNRDCTDKKFYLVSNKAVCPNMKKNTLDDILYVLETEENEIIINEEIAKRARQSIEKMIAINV